jgi:hypothetical protein
MSAWYSFATAPLDREIYASQYKGKAAKFKTCGQRFRWDGAQWLQCVAGRWYQPFFTPTHWADIPESGERPEPMF